MRPIKLTVCAFGPYAGTQTLDFRDLKDRTFFLIHGRTGGGKTSLLDAMCYALYGDTSGNERDGKDMRSHHADAGLRTEVTFDFSIGREIYRVTRSPQQERPRKKGGGMTVEQAQATLWRRTGLTLDSEEGSVLAAQPGKVSDEVERLLGFKSDQFRQVVILPQGKFRQLLTAESADREKILETLFKTEIYKRIELVLKEAAREIKTRWNDASTRSQILLQQADVGTIAELHEQRESCTSVLNDSRARVEETRLKQEAARLKLNEGLQSLDKLKELADAEMALSALSEKKDIFNEKAVRLKAALQAAKLAPTEAALIQRKRELSDSMSRGATARASLTEAEAAVLKADQALRQETNRDAAREDHKREQQKLDELAVKGEEISKVKSELTEVEKKAGILNAQKEKLAADGKNCEALQEEKRERLRETESTAGSLEASKQVALNAEKILASRKTLEAACDELTNAIVEAEKFRVSLEKAGSALDAARSKQALLESSWFTAQAAILAEKLEDGAPCPVCGSEEHPHKAASDAVLPGEADLRESRAEVSQFEKKKEESFKAYSQKQIVQTRLQSQVQTLTDALGEAAVEDMTVLQQRARESKNVVAAAEDAFAKTKALTAEIDALKERMAALKQQQETTESSFNAENEKRLQLAAILQERESSLPVELREPGALEKRRQQVKRDLNAMESALNEAQKSVTDSNQRLAVCQVDLRNATELAQTAQSRLKDAETEFTSQLKQAEFSDEEAYRKAVMSPDNIQQLERDVQSFTASLQAASERATRAKDAARDVAAPEMDLLEKAMQEAQSAAETAVREESALAVKLQQIEKLLGELEKMVLESQSLEREFETIGKISEVANGNNGRKLTFQRFVLGALLDDVLLAASERLTIMSQGRYRLQRITGVGDLRKAGGLELEVFDSYTGTTRGVATLSGGESFLASLSLALGLSDVVQSYAGGIHLDTMFIDEGFGSLDPESLDFAIRALKDLQKSGRLVGIISHVPELRERIDARLEVLSSGQGSTVKICVG